MMRAALVLAIVLAGTSVAGASELVEITEISPNMLVFATGSGNVVASIGPDGALLVGTPSAASTTQISAILAKHTTSATRYVVIYPQDSAHSQGDAG